MLVWNRPLLKTRSCASYLPYPRGEADAPLIDIGMGCVYSEKPVVLAIGHKEEYGAVYCDVKRDVGPREFVVKGIRDAILDLGDGRVLIMDVDGNRCMVEDWPRLDDKSRKLLERVL